MIMDGSFPGTEEVEFAGVPSTQEWREDFPATQIPPNKPRNPYITPPTSFTVASDESGIDGFDICVLTKAQAQAQAPPTPAQWRYKTRQMPPTPLSIAKRHSSRESVDDGSPNGIVVGDDTEPSAAPTGRIEGLPASPTARLKDPTQCEASKVRRRRQQRRRRSKKHLLSTAPCSKQLDVVLRDRLPRALRSSTPEPWPLPFPLADRGIYPYLPPAKQFDQMVKFTSATEEHIDKWGLHDGAYPVPLLRQVLSAQECVHMGLYSQLEHMDRLLGELEKMLRPKYRKDRLQRREVGEKYRTVTVQVFEKIKFMRSITKQHQICYYESRIATRPNP